jgi:hypothetical protein
VGSRVGGSDGHREAESATAPVTGMTSGVGWRHRGLARCGQPGQTPGRWATAGRADGGGGAGRRAAAGRLGDGGGSASLGEASGTTLCFKRG